MRTIETVIKLTDELADLNLRSAHISEGRFSHVLTQF